MVEETQEELMERIKKMNPEELQEFQKSRCIFCHIVENKIPSKKVYEDDKVIAILDINPATQGHILVMPKEHYAIMPQIPKEILDHLAVVTKRLSQVILQSLGGKGSNILIQNGPAAGQKAQHFMLHIIPRYDNDNLDIGLGKETISENDYNEVKNKLQGRINSLFGITSGQKIVENVISEGEKLVSKNIEFENNELKNINNQTTSTEKKLEVNQLESEKVNEIRIPNKPIGNQVVNKEGIQKVDNSKQDTSKIIDSSETVENQINKRELEQSKIETQIPQSRLLDMSSVNDFIKTTNQDINKLKEVIEPEIVVCEEFDKDMKKDMISEKTIIEQTNIGIEEESKIKDTDIKDTDIKDTEHQEKVNHVHNKNKEDENENKESEISLEDISRTLGM